MGPFITRHFLKVKILPLIEFHSPSLNMITLPIERWINATAITLNRFWLRSNDAANIQYVNKTIIAKNISNLTSYKYINRATLVTMFKKFSCFGVTLVLIEINLMKMDEERTGSRDLNAC